MGKGDILDYVIVGIILILIIGFIISMQSYINKSTTRFCEKHSMSYYETKNKIVHCINTTTQEEAYISIK